MIRKLIIDNFKSIKHEELDIKPLTILTGLNSTGKSSLIQTVLLLNKLLTKNGAIYLSHLSSSFSSLRNIYERAQKIKIELISDEEVIECSMTEDGNVLNTDTMHLELERNLFYLSANRIGPESLPAIASGIAVGTNGEYLFGAFEKEKSARVYSLLIKETSSYTLSNQVNYWLTYILSIKLELMVEKRSEQHVEVKYKSDGIPNITPFQLGAGVSYLVKVLILCLRAMPGNVIILENPEIHLHPAAQARLGEFFAFIANAGIQLIIETHCENLINRLQYEVFRKNLSKDDITVLYKKGIREAFTVIDIKDDGQYTIDFPDGFFDATLADLLAME